MSNKVNGKLDFRGVKLTQFDPSQTQKMEFSELHSAKRVLPTTPILQEAYTHFSQVLDASDRPTSVTYYQASDYTIDRVTFVADSASSLAGEYYVITTPVSEKTIALYQVVDGSGAAPGVADEEYPVAISANDPAAVVAFANKQVIKNSIDDLTLQPSPISSTYLEFQYEEFGEAIAVDVSNSSFSTSRTKSGDSFEVGSVELEYDASGNVIWQGQTLKGATYDPYKASFTFPERLDDLSRVPTLQKRVDEPVATRKIYGYAKPGTGGEEAKWLIYADDSTGSLELHREFAIKDGDPIADFVHVWNNRDNILPEAPTFANTYSTLFDGVDEYVDIPDNNSLDITNDISMSVWVKPSLGSIGDANYTILSKATGQGKDISWFFRVTVNGNLQLFVSSDGSTTVNGVSTGSVVESQWAHVAVTYDSAQGIMSFYINGSLSGQPDTTGTTIYSGTANVRIGARAGSTGDIVGNFPGNIDEVSLWKSKLSSQDITEIYNNGKSGNLRNHTKEADLVSWWHMGDGDVFPLISDAKGTNTGSMTNMEEEDFKQDTP